MSFAFDIILVFAALIIFSIWVTTAGFISRAGTLIHQYRSLDSYFKNAYWYTFWAAFITWGLVVLVFILVAIVFILLIIGLFTGFDELGAVLFGGAAVATETTEVALEATTAEKLASSASSKLSSPPSPKPSPPQDKKEKQSFIGKIVEWILLFIIFGGILLSLIVGVLGALAASNLAKSPNFDSSNSNMSTSYKYCIIGASISLGAVGFLIIGAIVYFIIRYQRQNAIKKSQELDLKLSTLPPSTSPSTSSSTPSSTSPSTSSQLSNQQLLNTLVSQITSSSSAKIS